MWGNARQLVGPNLTFGHDTFVFKDTATQTVGTQNFIEDFSQTNHDVIVFSGIAGVHSFADLTITQAPVTPPSSFPPTPIVSTVIHAGADVVNLVGFTGTLTAHDFSFA